MRIRPTELGCKGMLLLAALVCAFLATAYSNLFFLLLAFCCALGGLAAWWTLGNLRGLTVGPVDLAIGPADQPRAITIEVRAARPRWDVTIELLAGDCTLAITSVAMVAGTMRLGGMLPAQARGIVAVRGVRLSSRFPLALFRASIDQALVSEIVTHPAPHLATKRRGEALTDGDLPFAQGARGAGMQGLRPFRTGDSMTDVHWKATARRGTAVVKERDRHSDREVVVVLDRRCTLPTLEDSLRTLASLVLRAREQATSLRVLSQGASFRVQANRSDEHELLRWLAATSPLPADAAAPPHAQGAWRLPRDRAPEARP